MRPYHAKENSRRKNDVVSKCKTKLTGLVLPGIMNVDTVIPEITEKKMILIFEKYSPFYVYMYLHQNIVFTKETSTEKLSCLNFAAMSDF